MRLRKCQDELVKLANKVVAKGIHVSTAHIVPGGGKSIGGMLFFQRLREMGFTHVAWIVPRVNLASQAEGQTSRNADDPKYIDWGFQIEKLTDFGSPLTVYGGITTTIQSLCNKAKALVLEQQMKVVGQKWLLIGGIILTVFGIGSFLKYAFDQNWVAPPGRVGFGVGEDAGSPRLRRDLQAPCEHWKKRPSRRSVLSCWKLEPRFDEHSYLQHVDEDERAV